MASYLEVMKQIAPKGRADIIGGVASGMDSLRGAYDISTTLRRAHFVAQVAHESDGFRTTVEYASGKAYEGRKDLGNTQPGDGARFKGRALIQITGRANYRDFSKVAGVDFLNRPDELAKFPHALTAAAWFWSSRKLNGLADLDDIKAITKRINGGLNGFADRKQWYSKALAAFARAEKAEGGLKPETKGAALNQAARHDVSVKTNTAAAAGSAGGGLATPATAPMAVEQAFVLPDWGVWVIAGVLFCGAAYFAYRALQHASSSKNLKEIVNV